MDREEAMQRLQEFKEESGLGRDTLIDVYNHFRVSPDISATGVVYKGELVKVSHDEFWDYINTSDIREICKSGVVKSNIEEDFDTMVTKLRKEKLNANDKLNFERRITNKSLRTITQIEEFEQEIIKGLNKLKPVKYNGSSVINLENTDDVLVLSIGDWHLGEKSSEFKDTGFDMTIASKRIKKYADYVKKEILSKGIKKVVIMCGGDICNNVTLLSKRLMQTSNRAITTIMGVILLQHLILDIYEVCENIIFAGVGNNESRYDENYFEDECIITNCADYVIYNMLELLLKDLKGIKFLSGRNCEKVVNINNQNFLLTHGVTFGKGDVEKAVQQAISRYSVKGIDIRYVLLSHIHCTRNSNYFSRHGSLCGANAYSNTTLNLQTRASQNILFVNKNGDITPIAVDLENVDNIIGYDISNEIEKFNLQERDTRKDLNEIQVA